MSLLMAKKAEVSGMTCRLWARSPTPAVSAEQEPPLSHPHPWLLLLSRLTLGGNIHVPISLFSADLGLVHGLAPL